MPSRSLRPPGRPRFSPPGQTADDVLLIAAHLFMAHGYDRVTMDDVAHAALITKAAIYYYFPTKSGLFVAALANLLQTVNRETAKVLAEPLPLRQRLVKMAEMHLKGTEQQLDWNRIIDQASPALDDDQRQTLYDHGAHLIDTLKSTLESFTSMKPPRSQWDPESVCHAYMALLSVANARDRNGNRLYSSTEAANLIVDVLWPSIIGG